MASLANASPSQGPEHLFDSRLKHLLRSGDRVLDAGCGSGEFSCLDFAKELNCQIIGVDRSDDLFRNPNLNYGVRADLTSLPFASERLDVVNCRLVIEHLRLPQAALNEFHRVLKSGGRLAIFAPNLLHYFGMAAKVTPHWFH